MGATLNLFLGNQCVAQKNKQEMRGLHTAAGLLSHQDHRGVDDWIEHNFSKITQAVSN